MNLAQIDFQQLRIKHILYKSKVRSVLYGGDYDEAFFSRSGPLNSWFNTIGLIRYGQEPEMQELSGIHKDLHKTADQLFNLYKRGNIEQAHDGLKTIEVKSERFSQVLTKLETKLKD